MLLHLAFTNYSYSRVFFLLVLIILLLAGVSILSVCVSVGSYKLIGNLYVAELCTGHNQADKSTVAAVDQRGI